MGCIDKKISELTNLAAPAVNDLLVIVDVSVAGFETKNITVADLVTGGIVAPADAQYVTLAVDADLTNERVLTGTANQVIVTDGGAGGPVTLSTPQDINVGSTPTFAGLTINGNITVTGTVDGIDIAGFAGASFVTIALSGFIANERVLTGTANQVIVTDGGAGGNVTLSLPQDIHTGATPQFAGMTITGINGIDYNPGGDVDADIVTVGVTGAPTIWWDESEDAFNIYQFETLKHAAIGSVSLINANYSLNVNDYYANPTASKYALYFRNAFFLTVGSNKSNRGVYGFATINLNGQASTGIMYGGDFTGEANGAGSITGLRGGQFQIANYGTATVALANGITITRGVNAGGGVITSLIGLRIEDQNVGINNYAIHTDSGVISFGDNLQFRQASSITTTAGDLTLNPAVDINISKVTNYDWAMGNSTKDPTTDAPVDWVQIEIADVIRYLPAYAA